MRVGRLVSRGRREWRLSAALPCRGRCCATATCSATCRSPMPRCRPAPSTVSHSDSTVSKRRRTRAATSAGDGRRRPRMQRADVAGNHGSICARSRPASSQPPMAAAGGASRQPRTYGASVGQRTSSRAASCSAAMMRWNDRPDGTTDWRGHDNWTMTSDSDDMGTLTRTERAAAGTSRAGIRDSGATGSTPGVTWGQTVKSQTEAAMTTATSRQDPIGGAGLLDTH